MGPLCRLGIKGDQKGNGVPRISRKNYLTQIQEGPRPLLTALNCRASVLPQCRTLCHLSLKVESAHPPSVKTSTQLAGLQPRNRCQLRGKHEQRNRTVLCSPQTGSLPRLTGLKAWRSDRINRAADLQPVILHWALPFLFSLWLKCMEGTPLLEEQKVEHGFLRLD